MPRLGHKKSRLGCRQCKARHVKCDELKPCSNCSRHGVTCSLTDPESQSITGTLSGGNPTQRSKQAVKKEHVTKTSAAASSSSPSLHIDYVLNPPTTSSREGTTAPAISEGNSPASQPDQFPFLSKFLHSPKATQSDIWILDLELMHHWSVEAYESLSLRADMRHAWRVETPKQAITHTFLMHEILAFSALHKVYLDYTQKPYYYACGIHHQDMAIRGVRKKLLNVKPDEAAAVMATSTLLTLTAFASTGFEAACSVSDSSNTAVLDLTSIFHLMQGMGNVLTLAHQFVVDSFLAPMIQDPQVVIPPQPLLGEIGEQLPALSSFVQDKRDLDDVEKLVLLEAITSLTFAIAEASPPRVDNRELRFLFTWALRLKPIFLEYMQQQRQGALVVLSYYAIMFFAAEPGNWYLRGWGARLMSNCCNGVDETWAPAMQWPISFLRRTASQEPLCQQTPRMPNANNDRSIAYRTYSRDATGDDSSSTTAPDTL
ncbi:hypothetical protein NX059_010890 [Plenodomus lindquistii]|nr:hypothetical protein NX059_010890 [Plenodomus lindquistii]